MVQDALLVWLFVGLWVVVVGGAWLGAKLMARETVRATKEMMKALFTLTACHLFDPVARGQAHGQGDGLRCLSACIPCGPPAPPPAAGRQRAGAPRGRGGAEQRGVGGEGEETAVGEDGRRRGVQPGRRREEGVQRVICAHRKADRGARGGMAGKGCEDQQRGRRPPAAAAAAARPGSQVRSRGLQLHSPRRAPLLAAVG